MDYKWPAWQIFRDSILIKDPLLAALQDLDVDEGQDEDSDGEDGTDDDGHDEL